LSEETSLIHLLAYVIGLIPGAYFTYRLLVELYYYLARRDEDFRE